MIILKPGCLNDVIWGIVIKQLPILKNEVEKMLAE